MRICRFYLPGKGPRVGVVDQESVLDATVFNPEVFGTLTGFLSVEDPSAQVEEFLKAVRGKRPSLLREFPWEVLDQPPSLGSPFLLAPIEDQEVWAAGVTYIRSRDARMRESKSGGSFYDLVYEADRPELFFKATPHRVSGPHQGIRIRRDARWSVPEPELTLVADAQLRLVGLTIGNDMSSRDIEGQNPLYLPQAKIYSQSCALGPAILLLTPDLDPLNLTIKMRIYRGGTAVFSGETSTQQMKRTPQELLEWLGRDNDFPQGVFLMTGTGIVPPEDFTLEAGDIVEIAIPEIGTLRNTVVQG